MTPDDTRIGKLLDGRYRIERALGRGGMGTVYLATDERMGRQVVVKVPHEKYLEDADFRERFTREIRALTALDHPHVVKVLDAGQDGVAPFAVLQYLPGGSLRDRLTAAGGRLTWAEVSSWLPGIAEALDHVHEEGMLHRDVKPGNILFDKKGRPFLADFGIAKAVASADTGLTQTGMAVGTADYMAPEVSTSDRTGPAYDQYALAVVVYESLSGALPHERTGDMPRLLFRKATEPARDLGPLVPHVPANVVAAVMRALERDPAARFGTCMEFARAHAVAPERAPAPTATMATAPAARVREAPPDAVAVPSWAKVSPSQVQEASRLRVPVAFENSIGMRFVLVPPGTFRMGSPASEESRGPDEIQHEVTLSKAYYLSAYATTNGQYRRYKAGHDSGTSFNGDSQPVVQVSHDDAAAFVAWLNAQDRTHAYRLPTEAEWEHACRAGTTTPFSFGETISTEQANYNGKFAYGRGSKGVHREKTTDVGSFPANRWGLFDMHGNASQWCSDWYGNYPSGRTTDPVGPASGTSRVLRGGAWYLRPETLRSAYRGSAPPDVRGGGLGFRVAAAAAPR